jgi:K+-sensing histidine kinase KdpD
LKQKRAGRKKGFGLGLYVAKLIVETHKGQIGVYNNREGGSTFYFTLPSEKPEKSAEK